MKYALLIAFAALLFSSGNITAQNKTAAGLHNVPLIDPTATAAEICPGSVERDSSVKIFSFVEVMPKYQYGEDSLRKFIQANIHYDSLNLPPTFKGRLIVRFIVDARGNVIKPEILRGLELRKQGNNHDVTDTASIKSLSPACENQALRIINMLHFSPGIQLGKPVDVYYNLPILFSAP